jgi:hypothetical protein
MPSRVCSREARPSTMLIRVNKGTWEHGNVGTWERGNVGTWERGNVGDIADGELVDTVHEQQQVVFSRVLISMINIYLSVKGGGSCYGCFSIAYSSC